MALMDAFRSDPLPPNWQTEADAWQQTYFPEMSEVLDAKKWKRFYPGSDPTKLTVITAKPEGFAQYAGNIVGSNPQTVDLSWRIWKAEDFQDAEFMTALRIIRAQASTELGSIQQHRMVYEQLDHAQGGVDRDLVEAIHNTDKHGHTLESISFSKKRVCVEELRHHYQMSGVLTLDPTWDDRRRYGRKMGTETMEELFAMKPGEHVLDAFNIEFKSIMDSAVFMAFIDRVGKYQLEMQHHFYYGPMALSMPFMRFAEESYHLAAGEKLMEAIAVASVLQGGNTGVEELQRTLNMWFPRGLEMFGSELGGKQVKGMFKTLDNDEAQSLYIQEVAGKVRNTNLAVIQAKAKCPREEAERILARLLAGETMHGLTKKDMLYLPDRRFWRIRGLREYGDYALPDANFTGVGYVYLPYDTRGTLLTEGGKPMEREDFLDYLKTALPARYLNSRHMEFVKRDFLFNETWGDPAKIS